MKIKDVYTDAVRRLEAAGIAQAETEAQIILGHVLKLNRAQLFLAGQEELNKADRLSLESMLGRRLDREPLAYILGEQEFWSLAFRVTPDVLIPRPETEFLLECALRACRDQLLETPAPVLDLGVGSGAIAVVLARELPQVPVFGVDRSFAALQVAAKNAQRLAPGARLHLIHGNWLDSFFTRPTFGLIVSNPPYIAQGSLASLQPEVSLHEPRLALDGGRQGMEAIAILAATAHKCLQAGGWLFLEIGADQQELVLEQFAAYPDYDHLAVHKDYAGLPRVFQAMKRSGE